MSAGTFSQILPYFGHSYCFVRKDQTRSILMAHGSAQRIVLPFSHHGIHHISTSHDNLLHIAPAKIGICFEHECDHTTGQSAGGGSAPEVGVVERSAARSRRNRQSHNVLGVTGRGLKMIPLVRSQSISQRPLPWLCRDGRHDALSSERRFDDCRYAYHDARCHFRTARWRHCIKGSTGIRINRTTAKIGDRPDGHCIHRIGHPKMICIAMKFSFISCRRNINDSFRGPARQTAFSHSISQSFPDIKINADQVGPKGVIAPRVDRYIHGYPSAAPFVAGRQTERIGRSDTGRDSGSTGCENIGKGGRIDITPNGPKSGQFGIRGDASHAPGVIPSR